MIKHLCIVCFLLPLTTAAQEMNALVKLSHYVFDSFTTGKVQVKSGVVSEQRLNYNILTGEMIFDDAGRYLAIANPTNVDTVFIAGRKFIPLNNRFYEVLTAKPMPLLLEFTYTVEEPGAATGYGNASPTTNATSLKTLIGTGSVYQIKLPDDFKVIPGYIYWIQKEGRLEKAGSVQQLAKVFPGKKDVIKELVKKNHTNFSKREDLLTLVNQLGQ